MARVLFHIRDRVVLITLKTLLEADGHLTVDEDPSVVVTDDPMGAILYAKQTAALVVASATELRAAVAAMRQGVYGYIFLPLQPGEAELMVRRASAESVPSRDRPPEPLAEVEAQHIRAALRYCKGNRAQTARLLGIGRNTLWRKLRDLQGGPDGSSGSEASSRDPH